MVDTGHGSSSSTAPAPRSSSWSALRSGSRSGKRYPGHGDEPEDVGEVRAKLEAGVWDPLDLPGELIEVDKSAEDFSYDELADWLR